MEGREESTSEETRIRRERKKSDLSDSKGIGERGEARGKKGKGTRTRKGRIKSE